jgi:hypothetical protein
VILDDVISTTTLQPATCGSGIASHEPKSLLFLVIRMRAVHL